MVYGKVNLAIYGIWYMVYGIWYMVYMAWYIWHGMYGMVYGIWYMVWYMVCNVYVCEIIINVMATMRNETGKHFLHLPSTAIIFLTSSQSFVSLRLCATSDHS